MLCPSSAVAKISRDPELQSFSPVTVYMILSLLGGAHEGLQHLGPYGNIPNIVAELTGDNIPKDFSEDQGYPDPPNPCPVGKTGKLQDFQYNPKKELHFLKSIVLKYFIYVLEGFV